MSTFETSQHWINIEKLTFPMLIQCWKVNIFNIDPTLKKSMRHKWKSEEINANPRKSVEVSRNTLETHKNQINVLQSKEIIGN